MSYDNYRNAEQGFGDSEAEQRTLILNVRIFLRNIRRVYLVEDIKMSLYVLLFYVKLIAI